MVYVQTYICVAYVLVLIACVVGAFNKDYDANLLQRIAIGMLAIWSAWRVQLVLERGWGYPHEPMVATALLLYAIGSVVKTVTWMFRK